MSALLDKMNSLPKAKTVEIGEGDGLPEVDFNEQTDQTDETDAVKEPGKSEETKEIVAKEQPEEEKEPPKDAPKAERDAYKQRKIKAADEEKQAAKAETERFKKELEQVRKEKEEWMKQAQTVADRAKAPQATIQKETQPEVDINKDPVGFLAKKIDEVNNKFKDMEHQQTLSAAHEELIELEGKFSSEKASDYYDVMKHAEDSEVAKMKVANPNVNEATIRKSFKEDKIKAAVRFLSQGRDPVEGLYQLAKAGYGYQPKEKHVDQKVEADKKKSEQEKIRFDAVNKNKNKSATGLSAGGSTGDVEIRGAQTTKGRTLRDFAKLTKDQKDADYR